MEVQELQLQIVIRGFHITGKYLLFWDERRLQLDELIFTPKAPLRVQTVSSFEVPQPPLTRAFYHEQKIVVVEPDRLVTYTLQGTLKKSASFRESEGAPQLVDLNGKWMCVSTVRGYLQIYDLSERYTFESPLMPKNY